jgi:hypothetical protein
MIGFARRFDPLLLLATLGLGIASIAAVRVSAHPESPASTSSGCVSSSTATTA